MRPAFLDLHLHLGAPGGAWTALLALVIAAALFALAVRDGAHVESRSRRGALLSLRALTLAVTLLWVLQPEWTEREVQRVQGKIAVLADVSRSMSVRMGGDEKRKRLDVAREVVQRWSRDTSLEPLVYGFGRDPRATKLEALAANYPATDDDTRIGAAIEQVVQAHGDALGAIVVVSDGADLASQSAAARAEALGVRVHTLLVGAAGEAQDDAIVEVRADPVAFLRQEAQVEVTLQTEPARQDNIIVSLRRGGQVVREIEATLDDDGRGAVTIPFPITELGRSVYTVTIPQTPGDAVPENNERAFLINATRDRLRVLLVCGHPSWDARFLRAFLKENPGNDLITFFILRTQSDMSMASPSELSLIPFPTDELFREHLASFDVVVFQDFNYGPYQMAQYLPRVRDFVREGGSFAMIGGNLSFGAGQYEQTPLAEVLPVEMVPGAHSFREAPFRPLVASGMGHHPLVALLPEPQATERAWASLATVPGQNALSRLRPGATALLVHPQERGSDGAPMVTLAIGESGKGRVLALATDGSWRWGMATAGTRGDASAYEQFWDRALRWLARDPMLAPSRVATDRERYTPAGELRVELTLRDHRHAPLRSRDAEVVVLDREGTIINRARVTTDARGAASAALAAPEQLGGYRVAVRLEGEERWLAEEGFVVEAGGDELANPRPDANGLRALAERTGGQFFEASDAPGLDALDRTRSQEMGVQRRRPMASAWFLAIALLCFLCEWLMRRRWGLR